MVKFLSLVTIEVLKIQDPLSFQVYKKTYSSLLIFYSYNTFYLYFFRWNYYWNRVEKASTKMKVVFTTKSRHRAAPDQRRYRLFLGPLMTVITRWRHFRSSMLWKPFLSEPYTVWWTPKDYSEWWTICLVVYCMQVSIQIT